MGRLIHKRSSCGHVYYNGRLAGTLERLSDGFIFTYELEYLALGVPIGFCFPLQEASFISRHLPGFFENLVSEGWLRKLQSKEQKIDENDRFSLLLANGRDLVGAVSIIPAGANK